MNEYVTGLFIVGCVIVVLLTPIALYLIRLLIKTIKARAIVILIQILSFLFSVYALIKLATFINTQPIRGYIDVIDLAEEFFKSLFS